MLKRLTDCNIYFPDNGGVVALRMNGVEFHAMKQKLQEKFLNPPMELDEESGTMLPSGDPPGLPEDFMMVHGQGKDQSVQAGGGVRMHPEQLYTIWGTAALKKFLIEELGNGTLNV